MPYIIRHNLHPLSAPVTMVRPWIQLTPARRRRIEPIGTVTAASGWLTALPKIELHLHLEGAMRPGTVRDLSVVRQGWIGPLPAGWERTYYTYTDFAGFMAQLTPRFPGGPREYARIAAELFEDLAAMNAIYVEVSFDGIIRRPGEEHRFWPIVEALEEERERAQERHGLRLNYIVGLMRTLPLAAAMERVQLAGEARRAGLGVVGIDLHGDETKGAAARFAPAYRLAAEYGLGLRAHAGEALGPESIWEAIELLGVRRIAHGIRAADDPILLERLQQGDITLELCPTSNVRTAVVPNLSTHPIRRFHDLGIPVTVNSDDPLPFFTTLEREYRLLVDVLGFTRADMLRLTLNAARAAFLPDKERTALIARIERAYDQF